MLLANYLTSRTVITQSYIHTSITNKKDSTTNSLALTAYHLLLIFNVSLATTIIRLYCFLIFGCTWTIYCTRWFNIIMHFFDVNGKR